MDGHGGETHRRGTWDVSSLVSPHLNTRRKQLAYRLWEKPGGSSLSGAFFGCFCLCFLAKRGEERETEESNVA